jgi:hypothetical protein
MNRPIIIAAIAFASAATTLAQKPAETVHAASPIAPIASVATEGVTLHGAMSVNDGRAALSNNTDVTAGTKTTTVDLARGGKVLVCESTTLHMAKDALPAGTAKVGDAGLMFSLDRGAFETDYRPGSYSDVILTPDLRLLVSPPGLAQVKLRVNAQGDTCVDNSGANAPYVLASSLMDGGVYRVQPGQRVLFVHGSLQQVVDNEKEPCGCPPATPDTEQAGKHPGGPSSTAADTAFPTAVSEGLAPAQTDGSTPVVPNGEAHAQVQATLSSSTPPGPPPTTPTAAPGASSGAGATGVQPSAPAQKAAAKSQKNGGVFHRIGRFFAKVFGAD